MNTNPNATYFQDKYNRGIRYEPKHLELRFWLTTLYNQGLITGFRPDDPGVVV